MLLGVCSRECKQNPNTSLILRLVPVHHYALHSFGHRHEAHKWDGGSKSRMKRIYPKEMKYKLNDE